MGETAFILYALFYLVFGTAARLTACVFLFRLRPDGGVSIFLIQSVKV